MYDYLNEHLIPNMDKLCRRVDRIETRFDAQPKIIIDADYSNVDQLIIDIRKLYDNFAVSTNLEINITLKGGSDDSFNP